MIKTFDYLQLFHVPILVAEVDLNHDEIANWTRQHLDRFGGGRYTSYFDDQLNKGMCRDMPYAERFQRILEETVLHFTSHNHYKGGGQDLDLKASWWFSVYKENDRHTCHIHPGAMVSGTYYPYSDKQSSPIRFRSPYYTHAAMTGGGQLDEDATLWHSHQPKSGEILFWPSWLDHEVGTQGPVERGSERVAISFNLSRRYATR
jgi:uncharacterized protein (TIGR02466 family)